ncbi:MAG TPA: hypothetical protein PKY50_03350 [Candidatus Competibacter sp.]|nr:hypothetical protein [Candidatus Competibacter sp.]
MTVEVNKITWDKGRPTNLTQLFEFYHEYVKLLYASVQTRNEIPVEMLFEFNAALDHLSRQWFYSEKEQEVVAKAYSHFKRACLDAFKIKFKEIADQYKELCSIDTSVIDNGDFDRKLHSFFNEIRKKATKARQMEGQPDKNGAVPAFEVWENVYADCVKFHQEFFLHEKLNWARRRGFWLAISHKSIEFFLGLLAGTISSLLVWWFTTR